MNTNSLLVSSNYKSTLDHPFSFITDEMRMLEYLVSLKPTLTGPWLLIGDLNEIILPSESRGGKFLINRAAKFQEVIREWCLLDLGLQGLDRALNDCDWRIQLPEAFVEHLYRLHFYHNPIFLRDRPFRFEAAWTSHEGYLSIGGSGCLGLK
ncbi:hypothetical protein Peur_001886 [Populus x canadensis]